MAESTPIVDDPNTPNWDVIGTVKETPDEYWEVIVEAVDERAAHAAALAWAARNHGDDLTYVVLGALDLTGVTGAPPLTED